MLNVSPFDGSDFVTPQIGDIVIYYTEGASETDRNKPAPAIVSKVHPPDTEATTSVHRPRLNLAVINPDTAKLHARVAVPAIIDDGITVHFTGRWATKEEHRHFSQQNDL